MLRTFALATAFTLFLTACDTDTPVDPDPAPNPDVKETDSVVISQERYDRIVYSDTVNISIVKENGLGATKFFVHDFRDSDHRSVVSFTSQSFSKGEVKVILYGARPSTFDPEPQLTSYTFSPSTMSVTDTITGVISSVAVVSGSGTTCRMNGQIILLP